MKGRREKLVEQVQTMYQDIDPALEGWEFKPGAVQCRLIQARDGRQVIQLRIDLGLMQLETTARPDGSRPHGFTTYADYLRHQARLEQRNGETFSLDEEQCVEADREFVQYYHRRICWLALHQYSRAVADAEHTLAFMDFVRDHSPGEEYTQAHEQYRGLVLIHRTHAAAAAAQEKHDVEGAINAIHEGLDKLRDFFVSYDAEEQMEENGMVQQLRKMEQTLRRKNHIRATLEEQLADAIAKEQYETAARLRDEIRQRRPGGMTNAN
jgi:hypothetical protein